jgi:SH3 domain protein
MAFRFLNTLIIGCLIFCPASLWAKTMYLTDRIEVGLRSGAGIEQRIITMVKTGDRVEVLEGDQNWSKVRLADGKIGWLATRFLVDQIKGASSSDPKIQEELRNLKDINQNLVRENEGLNQEKNRLLQKIEEATKLTQTLQHEKNRPVSPDLAELKLKNDQLSKEVALYKKQIADSGLKEKRPVYDDRVKWFLAGAAVLILGLVLGFFIARSRRKSHRYY